MWQDSIMWQDWEKKYPKLFVDKENVDFDLAANISFIFNCGRWIPWHVSFASTGHELKTYTIALSDKDLLFSHDDLMINNRVDNFPRFNNHHNDIVKECEMKKAILDFYEICNKGEKTRVIGAVDSETYWYLKNIIPNTILINNSHWKCEDLALADAFRKMYGNTQRSLEDWRSLNYNFLK